MTGILQHTRVIVFIRYIIFISLINALNGFTCAYSQDNYYEKIYTTENGLPHDNVLTIAADKTGFMWIGTWDGISRYDGYEFHNYFHDPEDTTSIQYFSTRKIVVDKYNDVWLYHISDLLSKYNRPADNFCYYTIENDTVLKQIGINDITIDVDGDLLVTGFKGIARFNHSTGNFTRIPIVYEDNRPFETIKHSATSFDNRGNIWLTSQTEHVKGTYEVKDGNPRIIVTESHPFMTEVFTSLPNGYIRTYLYATVPDSSGILLSNSGLRKLRDDQLMDELPNGFNPESFHYWYQKNNKLLVPMNDEVISIKLRPGEIPQALYRDNYGIIWYSTVFQSGMGTGLHRYNKTPDYFKHFMEEIDGVPTVVYSIIKDNVGNLLVGTASNNFIASISKDGVFSKLNVLSTKEAVGSVHVRSMVPYKNGIAVGYMKERLDYFDFTTRKFTNLYLTDDPTNQVQPYGFRSLLCDSDGGLIVGTLGMFSLISGRNPLYEKIWHSDPPGKGIYSLRNDSEGNSYAGSSRILIKLDRDHNVDTTYFISDGEYNIEDICFDRDGNMWLALLGGGLEHFDPETGQRVFYTTAHGLSNNTTYSILQDRHGNLWITTNNGISRFNTKSKKFRIFGPTDGLRIHEFNSDAAFLDSDGRMFFGGMGGVVSFHPDSILDIEAVEANAPLILTEFRVSGVTRHFSKACYETNKIFLDKGDDNFGITFACMDFRNAEKIKYRYRVLGYHENWMETDYLHRRINIAGLRPDIYTVEIESTDIFGEWTNQLRLSIKIPAMFYQTIWFSLVMIILGLGIITLFIIINNRQIRIKENQKQQYLKLESVRGQMNPHFIFNSLNSINYFIANNDRHAANRYISNFSKLIRSFLSNMSQDYVSFNSELESLEDYLKLEFLRFGDKFDYSLNSEKICLPDIWEVFPGMVQPFVENAIWHGVRGLQDRKGIIHVDFSLEDNIGILCKVTDDGIGRRLSAHTAGYSENKKSRGIQLILERLHLINHLENKNYSVKIEDLNPDMEESGTQIIIEIPSRMKKS